MASCLISGLTAPRRSRGPTARGQGVLRTGFVVSVVAGVALEFLNRQRLGPLREGAHLGLRPLRALRHLGRCGRLAVTRVIESRRSKGFLDVVDDVESGHFDPPDRPVAMLIGVDLEADERQRVRAFADFLAEGPRKLGHRVEAALRARDESEHVFRSRVDDDEPGRPLPRVLHLALRVSLPALGYRCRLARNVWELCSLRRRLRLGDRQARHTPTASSP